jgi:hypothetical protein
LKNGSIGVMNDAGIIYISIGTHTFVSNEACTMNYKGKAEKTSLTTIEP